MVGAETRLILAALERILYAILGVLGVSQALGLKLDKTATESTPYRIQGQVDWIGQQLTDHVWGLSALHTQLVNIANALDGINTPVLDAIAALPAGSSLPTVGDIASGAWGAIDPNSGGFGLTYGQEQFAAFGLGLLAEDTGGQPSGMSPWFICRASVVSGVDFPTLAFPPDLNWATLRPDDTVLSWLRRERSDFTWTTDGAGNRVDGVFNSGGPGPFPVWTFKLTEPEFESLRRSFAAIAPVWPGLEHVTLGTPVALGANVTIPGPLDGLLIALTTPPSGLSNFTMGGQTWYYRAGQVAFVSDNGDTETWQYITWTNALYCPRAMARAASAILRGLAGVEGTVTPWLTV